MEYNKIFCTKCGSKNNSINLFCSQCGNEFIRTKEDTKNNTYPKPNINKLEEIKNVKLNNNINMDKGDLERFISKNTDYYMRKFEEINITKNKISWNWPAFLFTGWWMLYRKMYIQALLVIIGVPVLSLIPVIGWIFPWAIWILGGMYGNSLYLDHINKKMDEIDKFDSSMRDTLIYQKGGTLI